MRVVDWTSRADWSALISMGTRFWSLCAELLRRSAGAAGLLMMMRAFFASGIVAQASSIVCQNWSTVSGVSGRESVGALDAVDISFAGGEERLATHRDEGDHGLVM